MARSLASGVVKAQSSPSAIIMKGTDLVSILWTGSYALKETVTKNVKKDLDVKKNT